MLISGGTKLSFTNVFSSEEYLIVGLNLNRFNNSKILFYRLFKKKVTPLNIDKN